MRKKTLVLTVVVCAIAIMPVQIPMSSQDVVTTNSSQSTFSLVSTANALPPDCDDGMFSARCLRALIMNLFGGRDNWFD